MTERKQASDALALVGIGCRLPGGVRDVESFWEMLVDGRSGIIEVPDDRWNTDRYYHPDPAVPGRMATKWGGFVNQLKKFDATFWGISRREAMRMDPQQRWLLETAWEALEDAGAAPSKLRGTKTGVFVGISSSDYGNLQLTDRSNIDVHTNTGGTVSVAANRVSYLFDFKGPSMAVDTACSSALVAVSLACRAIWSGECEAALAGGVNALITPHSSIGFSKATMLSPSGECFAFDERANGYVRGEGAGVVYLKPLCRALEDKDPIYAVIRAARVNQDGHTSSMTVPGVESQSEMLRLAYHDAGIPARHVVYVEAHGTGTSVGDPIETMALGKVLSPGRPDGESCLIGSVKTNIGHLESASGIAGLIKAALVLDRDTVPPNRNFETPNPQIPFDRLQLKVAARLQPLPRPNGASPAVSVNSFGFGGTNAHAVLGPSPPRPSCHGPKRDNANRPLVLPISARDDVSLRDYAKAYRKSLEDASLDVSDFCYSAAARKEHHNERLAVLGHDAGELRGRLDAWLRGSDPVEGVVAGRKDVEGGPVIFVFTGQGPQWWAMGRQLFEREPIVRQTFEEIDRIFQEISGWSLIKEMTKPEEQSNIHRTAIAQPAIFALQVALAELWKSWGIRPDRVLGHSMGEVAAAHCAGVFSLRDAVLLIYHRSRLQDTTAGHGRMLATGLKPSQVRDAIGDVADQVELTAINSPDLVTLAGDTQPLETIAAKLEADGRFVRWLRVNYAFHTHQMDPIKDDLLAALADLQPRPSRIPFVSTVTGKAHPGERLDATYWWCNVRQPVLFGPAISHQIMAGGRRFLELGPHPALRSSIDACLAAQGAKGAVFHSLARNTDESLEMLANLAGLHIASADINWAAVNQSAGNFVRLPHYPWHYEEYWLDSGDLASRTAPELHPLLGKRMTAAKPTWQFELDPRLFSYLADHRIWDSIVFPASGYVEIGLAVIRELFPDEPYAIEEIEITKALFVSEDAVPEVQVVFDDGNRSFSVFSMAGEKDWELNARGRLILRPSEFSEPAGVDLAEARSALAEQIDHERYYAELHARGYQFGPCFSEIQHIWRAPGESLAEIAVPENVAEGACDYHFHPAVLDACFQAALGTWDDSANASVPEFFYLPKSIRRIQIHQDKPPARVWAHARQQRDDGESIVSDILVYDDKGRRIVDVLGLCVDRVKHKRASDDIENCLYQFNWEPQRLRGSGLEESCQFVGSSDIVADVQSATSSVYDEHGLSDYYTDFSPRMEQIAHRFIENACTQLGWRFRVGDRFTFEEFVESLGIVTEHHRLARAELDWLEADRSVRHSGDHWEVLRRLQETDAAGQLKTLADDYPRFASEAALFQATGPHLAAVLSGRLAPLELLFPGGSDELLENFYTQAADFPAFNRLIRVAVSSAAKLLPARRAIRVLEIGAGTGSLTRDILDVLPADRTEYLFTDLGPAFIAAAKKRFAECAFVDYQTFDVEREPQTQNIERHGYDLILATNVLHATADLSRTLANLQACLASGGMLMFLEVVRRRPIWDNVFGLLKGWWNSADSDVRHNSPLLEREQWESLLSRNGFHDVRSFTCSPNEGEYEQSVFVSFGPELRADEEDLGKRADSSATRANQTNATFVIFSDRGGVADALVNRLNQRGQAAIQLRLGTEFRRMSETEFTLVDGSADELRRVFSCEPMCSLGATAIVHLWSLDRPAATNLETDTLIESQQTGVLSGLNLGHVLNDLEMPTIPRVYFVFRNAQSVVETDRVDGLASSPLIGFSRVANNELFQFHWTLIDLDESPGEFELDDLFDEIVIGNEEHEIAFRNDRRYVNRLCRVRLEDAPDRTRNAVRPDGSVIPYRLEIGTPGILSNLTLNETPRRDPGPDEIEVRVRAGGINFRDVMKALGMYPGNPVDLLWFGDDFSGTVERVGCNVSDLEPGDRVTGIAPYCFRSLVTVNRRMVFQQPPGMSFEEAATLPTVFLTSHIAIKHLARMERGEKILIHAGTGGVGQAAIQIAQHLGLEIFATAGTSEKREMLKAMGVPHVMNSRTLEFADQIMDTTDGAGVDAVLNSLAGEFIPKSLSVLAPFGRFLEIGKVDVYGNRQVGLAAFKDNIAYLVIDLTQFLARKPANVTSIFRELTQRFMAAEYRPLPHKVFPITAAAEAFRFMAQSKHVGKNVLSFNEDVVSIGPRTEEGCLLRPDASYLITGGAGGFGLEVAKWMAKQGARNLVLMSRSGPGEQSRADIEELRAEGVNVLDVRGDVTRQDDVQRVIDQVQSECPPIKGVFHAAMVLDDDFLAGLDGNRFNRVLHPKMVGAWNLHLATREIPLEHFVCFSSLSAVIGATKQSNYNAGNCFLDALACHRRALGLPGLTLNWGAILGAGFVERNRKTADYLDTVGLKSMHVDEALRILREMTRSSTPLIAVGRVDWRQLGKLSPAVANLPTYAPVADDRTDSRSSVSLIRRLMAASPGDRIAIVEDYLAEQVAGVFGIETAKVDRTTPLTNLGLDSLMAVELMNRVESETGANIPMGGVLNGPNVQELAQTVLGLLVESTEASEAASEEAGRGGDSLIPLKKTDPQRDEFPLTVGQQVLWSEWRSSKDATGNVACAARIRRKVEVEKLLVAYLSILERHAMLRARVSSTAESIQRTSVSSPGAVELPMHDATQLNDRQLSQRIADHINRPFNLESGSLARLELFRCDGDSDVVLFSNHAIVADAASTTKVFRDLIKAYRTVCSGRLPEVQSEPFSYQDFVYWQEELLAGDAETRAADSWIEQLTGAPLDVNLPTDRPRSPGRIHQEAAFGFQLDDQLTLRLLALSAEQNITLQDTLFAAFALLIHRHSNQDDILIGFPLDGRSHPELRRVVGQFANYMPIRSQVKDDSTICGFLTDTGRRLATARDNRHLPLARLLDRLDTPDESREASLLQIAFVMPQPEAGDEDGYDLFQIGRSGHALNFGDLSMETIDVCSDLNDHSFDLKSEARSVGSMPRIGSDMTLEIGEACGRVLGWWHYNRELFQAETVARMSEMYRQILGCVVADPRQPVSQLLPRTVDEKVKTVSAVDDTQVRRVKPRSEAKGADVDFDREIRLDPEIAPSGQPPMHVSDTYRLFLTGATGFIGAFLLSELLDRTSAEIVCLVRARDRDDGMRRIRQNLVAYGVAAGGVDQRVKVAVGDLAKPLFGLAQEEFDRLASEVDVIYHNGADVNLVLPYQALRSTNVGGTREVLRLACHGPTKPTHVVSTFTVHTTEANRGQLVTETDPLPRCEALLHGYSQTKWVSEKMIYVARDRGVPVAIYRPGHVTGDSRTGASNTNDLLHTIVRACLRLGAAPLRAVEFDVTPVDYVAQAIAELSLRPESLGHTFHLTNPNPLNMRVLIEWMECTDLDVEVIPYEMWRDRLFKLAEQTPAQTEELKLLADTLVPRVLANDDAHTVHPRFDCRRTTDALANTDIRCSTADSRLFSTCLEYLLRAESNPRVA